MQKLASFKRVKGALGNFNQAFGERIVSSLKPLDLENYQDKREEEGLAPATIDMEISLAKTMVTKAFDNDLVDGRTIKAFRTVKRKLRKAANARKRPISIEEYLKLVKVAPIHLKAFLIIAINQVLVDLTRAIHHDFVLTYQNEPIVPPGGLKNLFITACGKAGIPYGQHVPNGITFHDIRRTAKTNMLNAGVDHVYRDIILGHSLHGMDVHYMAPSEGDLHRAIARYTEWLDGQLVLQTVDHSVDYNPIKG